MYVIPAIDIIDGKCVRLSGGDYSTAKSYYDDPLEAARAFEGAGLERLHLVDLDGAKSSEPRNLKVLERIASKTSLVIDFGGGVKSRDALSSVLSAGAAFVTCGSIAVKEPEEVLSWIKDCKEHLILGADCRNRKVSSSGWLEDSSSDVIDFISYYYEKGLDRCISTDIAKDGMLSGPSFSLYEDIMKAVPKMKVIASGGISSLQDLLKLSSMGLYGTIVGKAYYEGRVTLEELAEVNSAC